MSIYVELPVKDRMYLDLSLQRGNGGRAFPHHRNRWRQGKPPRRGGNMSLVPYSPINRISATIDANNAVAYFDVFNPHEEMYVSQALVREESLRTILHGFVDVGAHGQGLLQAF